MGMRILAKTLDEELHRIHRTILETRSDLVFYSSHRPDAVKLERATIALPYLEGILETKRAQREAVISAVEAAPLGSRVIHNNGWSGVLSEGERLPGQVRVIIDNYPDANQSAHSKGLMLL